MQEMEDLWCLEKCATKCLQKVIGEVEVALGECTQGDAEALGCSWPVWDTRGCVWCPH